jgi:hypothetical protein
MQAIYTAARSRAESTVQGERRHCQRIPLMASLIVSSLSRRDKFAEYCKTVWVNSYGCQIRSSRPLQVNTRVRLDIITDDDAANRMATGYVIHSEPVMPEKEGKLWNSGIALDEPGNFWDEPSPPEDWPRGAGLGEPSASERSAPPSAIVRPQTAAPTHQVPTTVPSETPSSPGATSEAAPLSRNGHRNGHIEEQWRQILRENQVALQRIQAIIESGAERRRLCGEALEHRLSPSGQSGETAMPSPHDQTRSPHGDQASVERFPQEEWQQTVNALQGHIARMEQVVAEGAGHAREQLEREAAASREYHLAAFKGELERTLEPLVTQGHATAQDLQRWLEAFKEERGLLEKQVAQVQQEKQRIRGWCSQETQRLHELIHDALVEAGGQIKGRIKSAVEMAHEPVERRVRDAQAQLEEFIASQNDQVAQRFDMMLQRIDAMKTETEDGIKSVLDVQRAEMLSRFRRQADDVTAASIVQMHATLSDVLDSMSKVLQAKLDGSPAQPSMGHRAGVRGRDAA